MKIDLLGIKIDALTKKEVLEQIQDYFNHGRSVFIVTPYSESIVRAQHDTEFKDVLNSADIALPDGAGILWAAHYLSLFPSPGVGEGQGRGRIIKLLTSLLAIIFNPDSVRDPIPEKISGSEFIWDLAKLASENNYSIFLLGGFGDTPNLAAAKLKSKFPNLRIAGTFNELSFPRRRESSLDPRSESGMTEKAIEIINQSRADFLFAALGPVRQEKWLFENRQNLRPKLLIGLGGTFDYLAGKRLPAPQIWRAIGLEWLWRLLTQPRRFWRITRGVGGLLYLVIKKASLRL